MSAQVMSLKRSVASRDGREALESRERGRRRGVLSPRGVGGGNKGAQVREDRMQVMDRKEEIQEQPELQAMMN